MLAQTLQLLERDGMINRYDYNIVPLRVEYTLTPLGKEAAAKVRDLADWIENNLAALTLAHNSPDAVAR
jgi:DNA-binding HxlR family transcriptional regulator